MKRIPIHRDGKVVAAAIVDDEDYERLSALRWRLAGPGYAITSGGRYMARLVHGLEPGDPRAVHHINEDKLDNRRDNLMVCESRAEANRQEHPRRVSRAHTSANVRLYTFEELLAMQEEAA